MNNPIIHIEVFGNDAEPLRTFYEQAFGWKFAPESAHTFGPMTYRIAAPEGGIPVGIGGNMSESMLPGIIFYVCVDDVDRAVSHVVQLGGKLVRPPSRANEQTPRVALVEDIEGHAFGLVDRPSLPNEGNAQRRE